MHPQRKTDLWDLAPFRICTGWLCVLTGLSAAAVVVASIASGTPSWPLIGFEVVIGVAGAVGCMEAFRNSRAGPAMALLCVAGAVGVGSLLGYVGAGKVVMGWSLKPLLVARLADAAILAMASGMIVLSREPRRSIPALIKGLAFGCAMAAVLGGVWATRATLQSASGPVKVAALAIVGVAAVSLIAGTVHFMIRAFSVGASPVWESTAAKPAQ